MRPSGGIDAERNDGVLIGGGGGGVDLDPAPLNCPSPPDGDVVSPPTVNARAAFGIEVFLRLGHVVTAKLDQLC